MAIVVTTPIATLVDNTDQTSYSMAAFTPTANAILAVFVSAAATLAAGTMTGGSLTWTRRTSVTFNGGIDTFYLFTAPTGASPGSTTPTFDCTGDNATGCIMDLIELTGLNNSSPVRQFKAGNGSSSGPTLTMDSALQTDKAYFSGFGCSRNPAGGAAPASWTPTANTGHTSPTRGYSGAYRVGGETGTTVTFTAGASTNWGMIAVEFAIPVTARRRAYLA